MTTRRGVTWRLVVPIPEVSVAVAMRDRTYIVSRDLVEIATLPRGSPRYGMPLIWART
jgi:hypothetical protein